MSMIGMFRVTDNEEIAAFLADPDRVEEVLLSDEPVAPGLDIDKSWHAIHFLLTGDPWEGTPPLGFIVSGGTPVGDDTGYGPPRAFSSRELAEIASALEPITTATLKDRYDAEAFAQSQIYPDIWDEPEQECLDDYVLHYFEELKRFIQQACADGKGLIVYLT
jgi:hypothetical protein